MKMFFSKVVVLTIILVATSLAAADMVLARRGRGADCAIAVDAAADETVRYAGQELRDLTKRMTGVELKVSEGASGGKAVILGVDRTVGACEGAFRLKVKNGSLYVTGGGPRGVLYGVYELLERFGGCEWFTPWCETISRREIFSVPGDLDICESPAFEQRETSWRHDIAVGPSASIRRNNEIYAARMRFNGQWHKNPQFGGTALPFPKKLGICHTFNELVPPKGHFAAHPEWFSEIKGRRVGERSQLCWSNRELVKFIAGRIKERLRKEPGYKAVGVSQNDWGNYCRCAECEALTKAEGSPAGPNLKFVNAIAEEVEGEFPEVLVETLAYQFTRKPPNTVRPRRNVAVCLCSYECSFTVPFTESEHVNTRKFCDDLKGWGAMCRNLFIYNYAVNFRNYLSPFPNVYTIAPNYKLFLENGARWIYDQADGNGYHGEFAELKCYLQSKLMWNPDRDVEPLIDRFMAAYYGAAAPKVRQYFNELYSAFVVRGSGAADSGRRPTGVGIYCEHLSCLTDEKLVRWEALWREAEEAVKDDAVRSYNVRMSALPVFYVRLKRLYESGYRTVWLAENLAPHLAGMKAIKPLAAVLTERIEEAYSAQMPVSFAEDYKRHLRLKRDFKAMAQLSLPEAPASRGIVTLDMLDYIAHERLWQIPIRLFAVDEGAKYCIRVKLRPKKAEKSRLGVLEDKYGFAAGLRVRWLPNAKGRKRIEFSRDKMSDGWASYDIGQYDISSLQKIPQITMDGLCLFVQGDIEIDSIEIAKASAEKQCE
jgi:hypothetical protein